VSPAPFAPVPALSSLLASAGFARAFTLLVFATVFGATAIRGVAGDVTLATLVLGLCALGVGVLAARRREIELVRLAPTTLMLFVAWAGASILWSADPAASLGGWTELLAVSFLAVVIGHVRDALQTVRALGDVLRWLLGASLALEILSGILLDVPIPFLGIQGDIAALGPVQGLFGTRNVLGFVTVIALITFLVEYRTQSVRTGAAIASVVLAGSLAALSGSPTVIAVALTTGAAALALTLVRRLPAKRRSVAQVTLGVGVIAAVATAYAAREALVAMVDARADFSLRTDLWTELLTYVAYRPVEGFGWFGTWSPESFPFAALNFTLGEKHASALDAYLDVLLQVGWAGLVLFLTVGALALARGWLVASERRSVVHAWAPLTLVALLTFSLFESFTLSGAGLLLLVVCAVRAGQSRSWRESLGLRMPPAPPTDAGPGVQGPPTAAG